MKITYLISVLFIVPIIFFQCNQPKSTDLPEIKPLHEFEMIQNIEFAKPDNFSLTADLYVPKTGKTGYPLLIIYHGGGWTINDKSVMDSLSMYVANMSEIMVMNVNYRLLGDQDNTVPLNKTVEDALGAFIWAKYNIASYGGDPSRIAVTGDSAGGHLAMMVALARGMIGDGGYGDGLFEYLPSYMPGSVSAEEVAAGDLSISAVIPNYAILDVPRYIRGGFEENWIGRGTFGEHINFTDNTDWYRAISPIHLVPEKADEELPPILLTVGSLDNVTSPESIVAFREELKKKDQVAEYWVYEGMPHAYLDSKLNDFSGTVTYFRKDGPYAADKMIEFLNAAFRVK